MGGHLIATSTPDVIPPEQSEFGQYLSEQYLKHFLFYGF